MNILPKKRWHVRTKENIARVRKDEAEAAEKDKQENLRIQKAEREARLQILKQKSKQKLLHLDIVTQPCQSLQKSEDHINLFSDIEHAVQSTNKSHDKEIKEKKEEYEKKIGYLTYLGQDTNEALGKKNWYDLPPESTRLSRSSQVKDTYDKLVLKDESGKPKERRIDERNGEIDWKLKQKIDPFNYFRDYCNKDKKKIHEHDVKRIINDIPIVQHVHKKKKKKNKKSIKNLKDNSLEKLQKLREARLKREQQEKYKTKMFLSNLSGEKPVNEDSNKQKIIRPKYNSQFNPELARQNYQ